MNWFEICATAKHNDLFLSSDGKFILVEQLSEVDPYRLFRIIGFLNDNIYNYVDMQEYCYSGFGNLSITYKLIDRNDYPHVTFADELSIHNNLEFISAGNKEYGYCYEYDSQHLQSLENGVYLSNIGIIIKIVWEEILTCNILGAIGVNEEQAPKDWIIETYDYHIDDLTFIDFDEEYWSKKYNIVYLN